MRHILKYNNEAKDWNEALPIGNGYLGAMVFGNPKTNRFQLNEDSIWYGGPMDRNNPDSLKNLSVIRELLLKGETEKAEKLMSVAMTGIPTSPRMYQTAGDLFVENLDIPEIDRNATLPSVYNYERFLDIDNAMTGYSYSFDNTKYSVIAFASYPSNVICIKFKAEGERKLNLKIHLERGEYFDSCGKIESSVLAKYLDKSILSETIKKSESSFLGKLGKNKSDAIYLKGRLGGDELKFYEEAKVKSDGDVDAIGEYLFVKNATNADLYLSIATSFRYEYPDDYVIDTVDYAFENGYKYVKDNHLRYYKNLYDRSSLNLTKDVNYDEDESDENKKSYKDLSDVKLTQDILSDVKGNIDILSELLFAYGKYLLISSSSAGSLPANLQGIWNKDMTPPWGSKFTININTEMNYWPAEMCNLPECHLPLFALIRRMVENGKKTAKIMYGCKGWVAHHNTDIWGDTAPVDAWIPGTFWVMGGAWLSTHIWKHYEYTHDLEFLRDNFYVMKESAEFFFDFLIEKDGYLVTVPSVSPENTFILDNGNKGCNGIGCTMDNQILRDLFVDCIKACDLMEAEVAFRKKAEKALDMIKPTEIGSDGRILEWEKEYEEAEPGHRHMSHLYGLHPSNQITVDKTPKLAEAARAALEKRLSEGGGHTGWSRAWIINNYAKLWDGEKVLENLILFGENSLNKNLFDNHPPFQIDGNFGVCAGICNMFVQSDEDRIVLLPALPTEFSDGEIKGIKCVGNIEVDITWKQGELYSFSLMSVEGGAVNVMYNGNTVSIKLKARQKRFFYTNDNNFYEGGEKCIFAQTAQDV